MLSKLNKFTSEDEYNKVSIVIHLFEIFFTQYALYVFFGTLCTINYTPFRVKFL